MIKTTVCWHEDAAQCDRVQSCNAALQCWSVEYSQRHQGNEMNRKGRLCQHVAPRQLDVYMQQNELESNVTPRLT